MEKSPATDGRILTCVRRDTWGWNYDVKGASVEPVVIQCAAGTGSILHGTTEYTIRVQGWWPRRCTLLRGEEVVAEARQPNRFLRTFELSADVTKLTISARVAFGSMFEIFQEGEKIGTVQRTKPPQNSAMVECDPSVPELVRLMAFWLVVLSWANTAEGTHN